MRGISKGMLAKSIAGHDKDDIYMIIGMDGEYVYLADGKLRKVNHPKKKKWKHIQVIKREYNIEETDNAYIQNLIKQYKRSISM